MSFGEEYNGWSNRETWVVNLWLSNEEPLYQRALEAAAEGRAEGVAAAVGYGWGEDEQARCATNYAARSLQNLVGELVLDEYNRATMLADLINSALARVEWREIAAAWGEQS
jgi:cytosine/adenosine deaminase-related metal-dependent hydrolase